VREKREERSMVQRKFVIETELLSYAMALAHSGKHT
jgi:hypothetical protein